MTDPITLSARVEALSGPCREADAEIYGVMIAEAWPSYRPSNVTQAILAPIYTASLDAAMTLAEPKRRQELMWEAMRAVSRKFDLHMCFFPDDADYGQELARAFVAAALRARVQP